MDPDRRKKLESRLKTVLGELSSLCDELGIELGGGAAAPAVPAGDEDFDRSIGPILIARSADLHIGFVARTVQELVRMVTLTQPVEPRDEVLGFVNVRGEAIPVLNLRSLLGQELEDIDPEQTLIILKVDRGRVAVVADEIIDIYELTEDNYQVRDALEIRRGFIEGVARVKNSLVAVIHPVLLARQSL